MIDSARVVAVLIGRSLDLYVSIVPAHEPEPQRTGWDLALALGAFAAVGWAATRQETARAPAAVAAGRGVVGSTRRCWW